MALTKFGFIVTGSGLDPARHVSVMESASFKMITIGVSKPEEGIDAAKRLVADGVQLIELCGGFGPIWTARILDAIASAVPVGSVAYGPESIDSMYRLFAPTEKESKRR